MVVLHLIMSLGMVGGTPRKLLYIVKETEPRIHHVFLVFAEMFPQNFSGEIKRAGGQVITVRRNKAWDIRLLFDIIQGLRDNHVDIICTHFPRADLYGIIAGVLTRKPVIKNVHGILWNNSRCLQRIDAILSRFRTCTVCNSNATKNAVVRQTGARNTVVIYNGIPNRAVTLEVGQKISILKSIGIPPNSFVIGHVGGLIPLRDQSIILNSFKSLLDIGVNTYLVFVGDGPLREALQHECEKLDINKRVRFLGYRTDVPDLLASFDCYVNMAREEGFGIAVVEAMQAGLPVVLANAGALPELIEDAVSGILVPPGDSTALAQALTNLLNDPNSAHYLGQAAKQRAATKFLIERYVNDLESLYIDILNWRRMRS
jgi:glycosyltransferase involved in cell wall biosynthesis